MAVENLGLTGTASPSSETDSELCHRAVSIIAETVARIEQMINESQQSVNNAQAKSSKLANGSHSEVSKGSMIGCVVVGVAAFPIAQIVSCSAGFKAGVGDSVLTGAAIVCGILVVIAAAAFLMKERGSERAGKVARRGEGGVRDAMELLAKAQDLRDMIGEVSRDLMGMEASDPAHTVTRLRLEGLVAEAEALKAKVM